MVCKPVQLLQLSKNVYEVQLTDSLSQLKLLSTGQTYILWHHGLTALR